MGQGQGRGRRPEVFARAKMSLSLQAHVLTWRTLWAETDSKKRGLFERSNVGNGC